MGYLADADPERADDADLGRSVERFVALASSSPDAVSGDGRGALGPAGRTTSVTVTERGSGLLLEVFSGLEGGNVRVRVTGGR